MPVPEGNISTSAVWSEEVIEVVEEVVEDSTNEEVKDDLPELS